LSFKGWYFIIRKWENLNIHSEFETQRDFCTFKKEVFIMAAINITADTFEQEVLKAEQTVLVDFWAGWCGPCKMLGPVIDQIADEHPEVKVCKVDVDKEPSLAIDYKVVNIPNLLVFKNGEKVNQAIGVHSKSDIEAML